MRSRIHIELTRTDFPDSGIDRCSHGALTSNLYSCFYVLPLLLERMPWTETESSWLACYAFSVSYLEWTTQKLFLTFLFYKRFEARVRMVYWTLSQSRLKYKQGNYIMKERSLPLLFNWSSLLWWNESAPPSQFAWDSTSSMWFEALGSCFLQQFLSLVLLTVSNLLSLPYWSSFPSSFSDGFAPSFISVSIIL